MVSIIIPVLNEEETIESTLKKVLTLPQEKEVIVVDGGSVDKTVSIASQNNIKVIKSKLGRAIQMNTGVKSATGDILWFLHSDSKISIDSLEQIEKTITNGYLGGCFSLTFYDSNSMLLKIIEKGSNLRAKYAGLIFGDQGMFIKKNTFNKIGGFPQMDLMEDYEFSIKVKKLGNFNILKTTIGTSSRRFTNGGIIKTFLLMQKIKLLYVLGVSPTKLKELYKESR